MLIFFLLTLLLYPTVIHCQTTSASTGSGTTSKTTSKTTTTTKAPNKNVTCVCDNQTTKSNNQGLCALTLDGNDEAVAYNGVCACQYYEPFYYRFSESFGMYTVSCVAGTTTTTTTTPKPTVPGEATDEPDGSGNGGGGITEDPDNEDEEDEEIIYKGSCNTTALSSNKRKITKIITYVASIWVILWTLITFIVNIACKQFGHHRFLGILEEISIIVLFIFMGFFSWDPFDNLDYCKITTIILQFLMVLILGFCVFEAIFAKSLIKGSSIKNGSIPAFLNYIIPFIFAAIPTALTYWQLKNFYASTGVHCFVATTTDMLWAFIAPNWILLIFTLLFGQLAFLACQQADNDVDLGQYFWSKKICKSLPIFSTWILSTYITLFYAFDQQKFWLFCVYLGLCLFLGPIIFICHTFCYEETATKLWNKTHFSPYKPCPIPDRPDTPEKRPLTPSTPVSSKSEPTMPSKNPSKPPGGNQVSPVNPYSSNPGNALNPPLPVQPNRSPISNDPTASQPFYDWLTDRNPNNVKEILIFDCEHRKQQLSYSPSLCSHLHKSASKEDLKQRFRPPHTTDSPLIGFSSCAVHNGMNNGGAAAAGPIPIPTANGTPYLRQRHFSMDNGHGKVSAQNSNFSMTHGIGNCVNSAAALCRFATINSANLRYRGSRQSWSDIEAETTALMAATQNPNFSSNKFDWTKPCSKCSYENEVVARKIDQKSRILFPSAFAIFCFAYWFYYGYWVAD